MMGATVEGGGMTFGWWIAGAIGVWGIVALLRRPTVEAPPGDDDGTLVQLVTSGFKVEAIRRFRARHGGGLKEAKEAVERLARGERGVLPDAPELEVPSPELEALVREGRLLEAIKAYREAHPGADLLTAKQAVDHLLQRMGG